jgi:hypothetical protein
VGSLLACQTDSVHEFLDSTLPDKLDSILIKHFCDHGSGNDEAFCGTFRFE